MSASASNSQSQQSSTQTTVQGGSGSGSTITGSDHVTVNDPSIALSAIAAAGAAIRAALANESGLQTQVAQVSAAQSGSNSDLIQQVLSQEQALASYQGTGGGLQTADSTKYLIWGGIGLAIVAVLALVLGRR